MEKKVSADAPIGVFDSGLGGLTVVRELRKRLPHERIIYFGDIARLPYGIKSDGQIRDFSRQNTEFLIHRRVKAVVIACNSSSSAAFAYLKKHYRLPIVDVIGPAAKEAACLTRNDKVGVIGTQATVGARAYERALKEINPRIRTFSKACPLLVPLVEEGILDGALTQMVLERYLRPLLREKIDTLILGCTHYPLLHDAIREASGSGVRLIDSAPATVSRLIAVLGENDRLRIREGKGRFQIFVSDLSRDFARIGERFLGEPLGDVKVVRLKNEITVNGRWI